MRYFLFLLLCFQNLSGDSKVNPAQELLFEPEKLESRIREALQRYIEDSSELQVEFRHMTKPDLLRGKFESIQVSFRNARIKDVVLNEGTFHLHKPQIQLNTLYSEEKLRIETVENTEFYLRILESDMNKALREKKLPLENPGLRFEDGYLEFKARFRTLFIKQLVETRGRFEVRDKQTIHFLPYRLKLNHIPLPGFIKNTIRDKINPVLDLRSFPLSSEVESIKIRDQVLEIRG